MMIDWLIINFDMMILFPLLLSLCFTKSTSNPGLQIAVTDKGLNYGNCGQIVFLAQEISKYVYAYM